MAGDADVLRALAGGTWARKLNWPPQGPPTTAWDGVQEVVNGRVTKLFLWSKGLTGSIPPELGNLTNLVELHLVGPELIKGELTGEIPKELGSLNNLALLSLSANQLTGSIPPELGQLQKLKLLSLSSNELTGTIPRELDSLTNLKQLELNSNQLTGSIPPELGQLRSLKWVLLHENKLTGEIPMELGDLGNLESLDLRSNKLTGVARELCEPEYALWADKWLPRIADGNLWTSPPADVLRRGQAAALRWFEDKKELGTSNVSSLKLVLLGEAEAGKTSLMRTWLHRSGEPVFMGVDDRTVGIDICPGWRPSPASSLQVCIWDFAGQPDYYAFHQLFLTPNALNVIVLNGIELADATSERRDNVSVLEQPLFKWLDALSERVPEAAVMLVISKGDLDGVQENDLRAFVSKYVCKGRIRYLDQKKVQRETAGLGNFKLAISSEVPFISLKGGWEELGIITAGGLGLMICRAVEEAGPPESLPVDESKSEEVAGSALLPVGATREAPGFRFPDKFLAVKAELISSDARACNFIEAVRLGTRPSAAWRRKEWTGGEASTAAAGEAPDKGAATQRMFITWEDALRLWCDLFKEAAAAQRSGFPGYDKDEQDLIRLMCRPDRAAETLLRALQHREAAGAIVLSYHSKKDGSDSGGGGGGEDLARPSMIYLEPSFLMELVRRITDHRLLESEEGGRLQEDVAKHYKARRSNFLKEYGVVTSTPNVHLADYFLCAWRSFRDGGVLPLPYLRYLWFDRPPPGLDHTKVPGSPDGASADGATANNSAAQPAGAVEPAVSEHREKKLTELQRLLAESLEEAAGRRGVSASGDSGGGRMTVFDRLVEDMVQRGVFFRQGEGAPRQNIIIQMTHGFADWLHDNVLSRTRRSWDEKFIVPARLPRCIDEQKVEEWLTAVSTDDTIHVKCREFVQDHMPLWIAGRFLAVVAGMPDLSVKEYKAVWARGAVLRASWKHRAELTTTRTAHKILVWETRTWAPEGETFYPSDKPRLVIAVKGESASGMELQEALERNLEALLTDPKRGYPGVSSSWTQARVLEPQSLRAMMQTIRLQIRDDFSGELAAKMDEVVSAVRVCSELLFDCKIELEDVGTRLEKGARDKLPYPRWVILVPADEIGLLFEDQVAEGAAAAAAGAGKPPASAERGASQKVPKHLERGTWERWKSMVEKAATAATMAEWRLVFLCAHDLSAVRCGPGGEGFPVKNWQAWVEYGALPALEVTWFVVQIVAKAVTGGISYPFTCFWDAVAENAAAEAVRQGRDMVVKRFRGKLIENGSLKSQLQAAKADPQVREGYDNLCIFLNKQYESMRDAAAEASVSASPVSAAGAGPSPLGTDTGAAAAVPAEQATATAPAEAAAASTAVPANAAEGGAAMATLDPSIAPVQSGIGGPGGAKRCCWLEQLCCCTGPGQVLEPAHPSTKSLATVTSLDAVGCGDSGGYSGGGGSGVVSGGGDGGSGGHDSNSGGVRSGGHDSNSGGVRSGRTQAASSGGDDGGADALGGDGDIGQMSEDSADYTKLLSTMRLVRSKDGLLAWVKIGNATKWGERTDVYTWYG